MNEPADAPDRAIRVLQEADVRALLDADGARLVVREAFLALHEQRAVLPDVMHFDFLQTHGEAHVKGSWLGAGHDLWTIKAATGFYDNPAVGLPSVGGFSLTLSARTGLPHTLILDNGWLTELRTGAAGGLAADTLARQDVSTAAILGSGRQAQFQLEALLRVREIEHVVLWGRDVDHATQRADALRSAFDVSVEVADTAERAVRGADVIVTATASREPILRSEWIAPGTHITAMGSDLPAKRELPTALLARADVLVVDDVSQAATQGELHHALDAGAVSLDAAIPLGSVIANAHPGRSDDEQITIADLTGVGVQDAAVAGEVARRAADQDRGIRLES
jgi:ornithine cyclodeaminase